MNLEADLDEAQVVGARRIVPVTGGTFAGPKLKGVVLPGGGDWLVGRPDGTSELDVRATLQTDDEQLIYARYRGIIHTPEGGEMYFRTTPIFETGSEQYDWLTRMIYVGIGQLAAGRVVYSIYEIL